jgi:hypothetical protein
MGRETLMLKWVDVVMKALPDHDSDFVETEDQDGHGIGRDYEIEWVSEGDGYHRLRIPATAFLRGITGHELLEALADESWSYDTCIVCGGPPAFVGLTVLSDGRLKPVAWCSESRCLEDRAGTSQLNIPRSGS